MSHEIANQVLWDGVMANPDYKQQVLDILHDPEGGIEPDFLGFVEIYYYLSIVIPTDRVIYDLGCATGIQGWFFRNHEKYVGVDSHTNAEYQFHTPVSEYHHMTIAEFTQTHIIDEVHFAVCNYVPNCIRWTKDVLACFTDIFVFYPKYRHHPFGSLRGKLLKLQESPND